MTRTVCAPPSALGRPLTALSGVGPVRAQRLERLGLRTIRDLLFYAPRGLDLQGGRVPVAEARESEGERVSVRGALRSPRLFRRGRRSSVLSAELADDSGSIRVLFFNQPWLLDRLRELVQAGEPVELYGRVVRVKSGPALSAPKLATDARPLPDPGSILPVYPLTEGVGQEFLRALCAAAVEEYARALREPLTPDERAELGLPDLSAAVQALHRPGTETEYHHARRRVALERLLALQARIEQTRAQRAAGRARPVILREADVQRLIAELPHRPTSGQRRVMREVLANLAEPRPMRRLLQADVGAGKTLVGLFAMRAVAASGGQAALLVPTEILAEQHYLGVRDWLEDAGVRTVLLTGSRPAAELSRARAALAAGEARLAVGTHALLSEASTFQRLDLAIIDEQQRFGVAQKRALLQKGGDVHLLLMTATPIPRTLALCLYGDMETSVLDEHPPGRGVVKTRVVPAARRERAIGFLAERMGEGERVFWICPRIQEDGNGSAAAEEAYAELATGATGAFGVELVHGAVPAEERARRIDRFRNGASGLLVGTSILEVGVDVPDATIMVIEGAERFGLPQLHQLRGRVGRGPKPSWCFLFGSPAAEERMRFLEETSDGFAIAEEDLRRRGMGDLAGARQAGPNVEGLGHPDADLELVLAARRIVRANGELAERYAKLDEGMLPALV